MLKNWVDRSRLLAYHSRRGIRKSARRRMTALRISTLVGVAVNSTNIDNVVVYPSTKLLYNRIKKAGNSSVLLYLSDALQGTSFEGDTYFKRKSAALQVGVRLWDLPTREVRSLKEYNSFTVFRNPYARCLSAFLNKAAGGVGFNDVPGFGDRSRQGFETFISFLENGGLYRDPHWWPQVDLLFWTPERFSHIAKLECLDQEMRCILAGSGVAMPDDYNMNEPHSAEMNCIGASGKPKVTGATAKVKDYFDESLCDRVFRLYRSDFEVGGYEKEID